jgi:hypothetical protein
MPLLLFTFPAVSALIAGYPSQIEQRRPGGPALFYLSQSLNEDIYMVAAFDYYVGQQAGNTEDL